MNQESGKFLQIILAGDRGAAYQFLKQHVERAGAAYVYEEVICQAMRELGEMWSRDEASVADEHLATATTDAALACLYPDFDWPVSRASRVFVACPQGERHALGARMLADLLALDGWDELYFGADVPVEMLAKKAAELHPRVVALSVTLKSHLSVARRTADAIRAASPATKILAGGRAVSGISGEQAKQATGADKVADSAAQAVELIREWR